MKSITTIEKKEELFVLQDPDSGWFISDRGFVTNKDYARKLNAEDAKNVQKRLKKGNINVVIQPIKQKESRNVVLR